MKDSITGFLKADKPQDYYQKLTEELEKLNKKFRMFASINKDVKEGMPFSVKDNICVKGVESTASSAILKGYVPPFDATAVERMKAAGFSFIGKTKMDEFGFGTFGINCEEHTLNPFDEKYVAGGSSAGAAAAAAVMENQVSIAESTGGSIACPAAFCGVVGFTPTYGSVSRYGLIDYASSLDKIGVLGRRASDIKFTFDKIRGPDNYDTTCLDKKIGDSKKKKLVIIEQLMKGVDEKVRSEFQALVSKLGNMGYEIEEKSVPFIDKAIPAYYIISMAEASTNLAKYTGFTYGRKVSNFAEGYNKFFTEARASFGLEAKRRVVLGTFVRSASVKSRYYEKALRLRQMLISSLDEILKDSFIISPTMPILTPKISDAQALGPVETYAIDAITAPPNLAGFPSLSFPYAYDKGMPLGAQIVTSHFNDYAILDFAQEWESQFQYKFKYNVGSL